ncbi:ribose 5-phosphate isomerase B [Mollicutes bacterium LVI A0039]|nr:ribose 5-phosphate isomerase B [Mollicutes bacterium LVI A0039]
MKIAIASDHAGLELRPVIIDHLTKLGHEVLDLGTHKEKGNYALEGIKVGETVSLGNADYGIIICGTGIGISIAANKVRGIRAAVCNDKGLAQITREHNDTNILALGARIVDEKSALEIVDTFLSTEFEGGRHCDRVDVISDYEESCIDC